MDKPVEAAWEDGIVAPEGEQNPYIPGTEAYAAWQTGYLMAREHEAEVSSPEYQVEELLLEVAREQRLEALGYPELVKRIHRALAHLGGWLSLPDPMPTLLAECRHRLQELTAAAVAVRHPKEDDREASERRGWVPSEHEVSE